MSFALSRALNLRPLDPGRVGALRFMDQIVVSGEGQRGWRTVGTTGLGTSPVSIHCIGGVVGGHPRFTLQLRSRGL